ncbi:hypothetical protein [Streptomyces sp. NRRL F-2664]|uniref:hypothetical protein n=1 Tax=Streptomyces sp. NRRL F-2664 TaxID=1463842 RepID=UPI0004C893C2|nr:hypothetical protein [Streptomyces sp. NRRL F-2664]
MVIPATSIEYLNVTVETAPADVDLTGTPPQFQFLPDTNRSNPALADWLDGEWDGADTARILIGPTTDAPLTRGAWHVWVRIDPPNDEHVVRRAGTLTVT